MPRHIKHYHHSSQYVLYEICVWRNCVLSHDIDSVPCITFLQCVTKEKLAKLQGSVSMGTLMKSHSFIWFYLKLHFQLHHTTRKQNDLSSELSIWDYKIDIHVQPEHMLFVQIHVPIYFNKQDEINFKNEWIKRQWLMRW